MQVQTTPINFSSTVVLQKKKKKKKNSAFQNTCGNNIKVPTVSHPAQMSRVVYKASRCWDCQDFYIGKTKRRLHDRKTEHFKSALLFISLRA